MGQQKLTLDGRQKMSETRNTPTATPFTHYEATIENGESGLLRKLPEGVVVEVGLDTDQVSDVLDSERYADWHCSLRNRLQELVDAGRISIKREYECTVSVTLTFVISDTVSAESEDDARDVFGEHVEENWQDLVDLDSVDIPEVVDVEVERAEL